jgi:hypothetical protein
MKMALWHWLVGGAAAYLAITKLSGSNVGLSATQRSAIDLAFASATPAEAPFTITMDASNRVTVTAKSGRFISFLLSEAFADGQYIGPTEATNSPVSGW